MCDLNPDLCGYCFEGICDLKTGIFFNSEKVMCEFSEMKE